MKIGKHLNLKKEMHPKLGEVLILKTDRPRIKNDTQISVYLINELEEMSLFLSKKTAKQLAKQLEKLAK